MASQEHIISLLDKVRSGTATAMDCEELLDFLRQEEDKDAVIAIFTRYYEAQELVFEDAGDPQWQKMLQNILHIDKEKPRSITYQLRRWLSAAAIIIAIGLGVLFYVRSGREKQGQVAVTRDIPAPVSNRATITLADGKTVDLDKVANGQLAIQGRIKLIKPANGQIVYEAMNGGAQNELQYNTIANPRGSKVIDMLLSDGTHVWLNTGSSIKFPVAFAGDERKVELQGEGYFEVAPSANPSKGGEKKRFIVVANGTETEVLGTHFNVDAYNGTEETKVTLLEGSVRFSKQAVHKILSPGQQGVAAHSDISVQDADVEQVMAWKNGLFDLNGLPFTEVMQELGNWYDVQVTYTSGPPKIKLFGKIGRDLSLSEVLSGLQQMGVQCRIEGRKLIIN